MWGHVEDFVARARELPGLADADLDAVLRELLDEPELVFVTRRDKAAQAVSLWRAVQTQSWRSGEAPSADSVAYDFEAIDHLVAQLEADERAWSEWFARTGREADPRHLRPARCRARATRSRWCCTRSDFPTAPWRCRASRASATTCRRRGSSATARSGGRPHERHGSTRLTASRARGRGRVRDPRGRRRAGQARAPVQRRQGLDCAAARGREGVRAAAAAVPGDARRHGPQLPRGDRVPRPAAARGRPSVDRRLGAGVDRHRTRQGGRRGRLAQPAADGDAARRDRAARVRRRVRRRPARRGALARQGAGAVVPRRVRPLGAARPARRAVDALQRADPPRRAHPRVPAEQLDRAGRVALHRGRGARAAVDLLRPPPPGDRARRDPAGASPSGSRRETASRWRRPRSATARSAT